MCDRVMIGRGLLFSMCGLAMAWVGPLAVQAQSPAAAPPQAEVTLPADGQAQGRPGWQWSFRTGAAHQFATDIDGGGDFRATRYSLGIAGGGALNDRLALNVKLGFERNDYRFSSATRLGDDPWDSVNVIAAQATLAYHLDEQWTIHGGPILRVAAEDSAEWARSITGGVAAGVEYRVNDRLRLGGGVAVTTRLEESITAFPIVQFHWQIDDQWALRSSTFDLGVQGGAGVELAWQAHPTLELAVGGQYQNRRFRLARSHDGVGEESACPVYLKASWQPCPEVDVTGFGGVLFGGRLELEDQDGHRVARRHFDPAFFLGGRVSLRF